MPDFAPFRALRFASDPTSEVADLTSVCSPPYDVIDGEQRAELAATDPHNMVHLILPDRYDDAAADLHQWRTDGVLVADDHPTFSVYRMTATGEDGARATTTGVIGALALEDDGVLPHERTLPKAKSDRLELLRATRANLEPVWGISLAAGLTEVLPDDGQPYAWAVDGDATVHELFRVADADRIAAITTAVSGQPIVLADGHHRYETSCTYRDERPADDRGARSIMMLVVELADEQLCVHAIHRLLTGLDGLDLRGALGLSFDVHDAGGNTRAGVSQLERQMREQDALGLVDQRGLALLVPRPELDVAVAALPAPLHTVDSARFDVGVRRAVPDVTLAYRNDAHAVAALVRNGSADAAVLLRPVTVDTIRAAAQSGVRMPEKTTFFAPKPRSGMVMRLLDG